MAELIGNRTRDRQKQTAEVFTPPRLVNEMLNNLSPKLWKENKTFCDPACGDGNILVVVLERKVLCGHDPIEALKTIYGVELMRDNSKDCRKRLYGIVKNRMEENGDMLVAGDPNYQKIRRILVNQIVWADSLKYDYEFSTDSDNRNGEAKGLEETHYST